MPSVDYYKRKIARLEKQVNEARAGLYEADQAYKRAMALLNDRATLVSIERDGRKIRLLFQRNMVLTTIETYGTWDQDVEGWRSTLLGEK